MSSLDPEQFQALGIQHRIGLSCRSQPDVTRNAEQGTLRRPTAQRSRRWLQEHKQISESADHLV